MKYLLSLFLVLTALTSKAQIFPTEVILDHGPEAKRINIVVMGDGFLVSEQEAFKEHAQDVIDKLFEETPYSEYSNFFNAIVIEVPSEESGTNHPATAVDVVEPIFPAAEKNTYFGGTFDGFNIHRLTMINNTVAAYSVLASNFPSYDQILILLNSSYYGGAGGQMAVFSVHPSAAEIGIHEMGHSFAFLKDEYWAGDSYAEEGINMTQETDPDLVKWKTWLDTDGVGIYQHVGGGNASLWYRPHENCKMKALGNPYCRVCIEGTIDRIYALVSPIDAFSPTETVQNFTGNALDFSVDLVLPDPNTLEIEWVLNGQVVGNESSLALDDVPIEPSTLTVTVKDVTTLSHHIANYTFSTSWTINNNTVAVVEANTKLFYKVFPNPTNDVLYVEFDGDFPSEETFIQLVSPSGKIVFSERKAIRSKSTLQINLQDFPQGNYVLEIERGLVRQTVPVVLK